MKLADQVKMFNVKNVFQCEKVHQINASHEIDN